MKKYMLLLLLLSCISTSLVVGAAQEEVEIEFEAEKWTVEKIDGEHSSFAYALRALISTRSREINSPSNESVLQNHVNIYEYIVDQNRENRYNVGGDLFKITTAEEGRSYNYPSPDFAHTKTQALKGADQGYIDQSGIKISYYYNTKGTVKVLFSHTILTPELVKEIRQKFLESSCDSFYFLGIVDGPDCDEFTFDIDDFSFDDLLDE